MPQRVCEPRAELHGMCEACECSSFSGRHGGRHRPATLVLPMGWGKACIATAAAMIAFLDVVAHQELRASEQKLEGPSPEIEVLQL